MDTGVSVRRVAPEQLHLDILPSSTRRAFLACTHLEILRASRWYLAGGTALALHVGHRQSVDLDFFTPQRRFRVGAFEEKLLETGQWRTTLRRAGTLYGVFMNARVSFIAYPFFAPSSQHWQCGAVRLLIPEDIAAMKIVAISQRGKRRDFFDLYWCCKYRESLAEIIPRALKQYPGQEHNLPHILKSLTYFADAESDPMPLITFQASWRDVKQFFEREVPKVARTLLGLR